MAEKKKVSFSHDVLPLLSDRCFHCHGPDESHRKAELRLDQEDEAKGERDGSRMLVPGDLAASEVWQRIITADQDELMPPPDSHRKPLNEKERATLRQWILEGAEWGKHWAFEKAKRPAVPTLSQHPIDAFILQKLKLEGLKPSPPAPAHTQLRRLSFDLTGLPPSPAQVDEFAKNPSEENWQNLVDDLLQSPHHGERLTMWWLDAARYSDTDGFQLDAKRSNWPWRDWVLQAFNNNMPFDQFTLEQFAGDLLPDVTPEKILATCFHRNHMTNGEGGRDPEESRIDYVIDRVNTTGTVWLGLTLGCTQCHSHKFDPIAHKDYYSLFAFFNSIDEDGRAGNKAKPYLKYRSPFAQRAVEETTAYVSKQQVLEAAARKKAVAKFSPWLESRWKHLPENYRAWHSLKPRLVTSSDGSSFQTEKENIIQTVGLKPKQDDYSVIAAMPKSIKRITGWKLEIFPHVSHTDGKLSRGEDGEFILSNVKLLVQKRGVSQVREVEITGAIANFEPDNKDKKRQYGKIKDTLDDDPRNGWTTSSGDPRQKHQAVFELKQPLLLAADEELVFVLLHRSTGGNANIGRFRISVSDQSGETVKGLQTAPLEELAKSELTALEAIDAKLRERLLAQFLLDDSVYQKSLNELEVAKVQLVEVKKRSKELSVMVLAERKEKRDSHVLIRGVWDAKGKKVQPGILPAILPLPNSKDLTRVDLAKWLTSPDNPLTARVISNHLWQIMFGSGLVRSPDDFGLQGKMPTHPDLLDWLAVELVESGWDLRHILRLIATSETYRQSSHVTPDLLARDPQNLLLARAPRFRLPAWMIRDNALVAAGLLNPAIGGPPVKPWQPKGVWNEIFMGRLTYQPSVGPAQYRRTLYAFWRRSSAPTFLFDSAQRRACSVGISRTNTPLHALTLLNDTTMLEASRVLAEKSYQHSSELLASMQYLALHILSRELKADEVLVFKREHQRALNYYLAKPTQASLLTTVGQQKTPDQKNAPRIAAQMTIASMMLNLDEAITHE
ncbi:MAG: PSD1 and planctomycete cytochrome C domain-containing protein [Verrucomicrobiales bacterium]|nr:PSD1 and planctomycete cytochrome C domain-containing protein [Verrucomicrobiales bacterium]